MSGNHHGTAMGLLTMPSVKKLHHIFVSGDVVVCVMSETHNGQTSGLYGTRLDIDEVTEALWKIAAARVARVAG